MQSLLIYSCKMRAFFFYYDRWSVIGKDTDLFAPFSQAIFIFFTVNICTCNLAGPFFLLTWILCKWIFGYCIKMLPESRTATFLILGFCIKQCSSTLIATSCFKQQVNNAKCWTGLQQYDIWLWNIIAILMEDNNERMKIDDNSTYVTNLTFCAKERSLRNKVLDVVKE